MKNRIYKMTPLLIFTFLLYVYSIHQAYASENPDYTIYLKKLEANIDSIMTTHSIPGACLAVVSKDSIEWIGCYGFTNMTTKEPMTENKLMRVASISKSLVALAFMKLAEDGKINLNTPIKEIIPEIEVDNPWHETDPVRIIHLLEHTSGFDAAHFYEYFNLSANPDIPLKDVLSLNQNSRKVRWRPGTRLAYTNHGYTVAGYILEKIVGQSFEEYLKYNILDPIGMTSSTFQYLGADNDLLAQGYTEQNQLFPYKPFYLRPASSLKTSITDMAKFVLLMLNRGKVGKKHIISEKAIDRMESTETTMAAKKGFKVGYGIGVKTYYREGFTFYAFSGGIPDFTSIYAYNKELERGCVIIINNSNIEAFYQLYNQVLKYITYKSTPVLKPFIALASSQLDKYIGYYDYCNPDEQLSAMLYVLFSGTTISCENDTLYQQDFMSEKKALIPISENTFRRSNEPDASIIFFEDEDKNLIMSDMSAYYVRTNKWKPVLYRIFIFCAILIMISQVLFAVYWIPIQLFKKFKNDPNRPKLIQSRIAALLATLAFLFGVFSLIPSSAKDILNFGQITYSSVVFYISTLLFALLSIASLALYLSSFNKSIKKIERIYYAFVVLSSCGMTIYLYYWGIIGLRLWAY